MELLSSLLPQLPAFVLVLARTTGVLFVSPIFGAPSLPPRVKIGLGLFAALALYPVVSTGALAGYPMLSYRYAIVVVRELVLGIAIGFTVTLMFSAFRIAGTMLGRQMGLAFGQVADPVGGEESTVLGEVLMGLVSLLFLAINGHHWIIRALSSSYSVVSMGGAWDRGHAVREMTGAFVHAYSAGMGLIAPPLIVLLLASVAIAIIGRAVQGFNVMMFAFPIRLAVGFLVIALALPSIARASTAALREIPRALVSLVAAP